MILYIVAVYAILMYGIPKIIKNPTNIEFVDNVVLYTNTNQQFIVSSALLVALAALITSKYLVECNGN
jgi:hypothetical protein